MRFLKNRVRLNPYSSMDPEGYLTNPNDGSSIWYHATCAEGLQEFNMFDYQGGTGGGIGVPELRETFFAGHIDFMQSVMYCGEKMTFENLSVKIKIGNGCKVFDARDLFLFLPKWADSAFWDNHAEWDDPMAEGFAEDLSEDLVEFFDQGDLGHTLNLWRESFSADLSRWFPSWADFVSGLWVMHYPALDLVMRKYPKLFPIDSEDKLVGWLEREEFNSTDPVFNPINLAIAHSIESSVPNLTEDCLRHTRVEIESWRSERTLR